MKQLYLDFEEYYTHYLILDQSSGNKCTYSTLYKFLVGESEVSVDNEHGFPINFLEELYNNCETETMQIRGQEVKIQKLIELIIKDITVRAKVGKIVILVPLKFSENHRNIFKEACTSNGVDDVEFVPYCISGLSKYIKSDIQRLVEVSEENYIILNMDVTFCDSQYVKVSNVSQKMLVQFENSVTSKAQCKSYGSCFLEIISEELDNITGLKVYEKRKIMYFFQQNLHNIESRLSGKADQDDVYEIQLNGVTDDIDELLSKIDSDDFEYSNEEYPSVFLVDFSVVERIYEEIEDELLSILDEQIEQCSDRGNVSKVLALGNVFSKYPEFIARINQNLTNYGLPSVIIIDPIADCSLLGILYLGDIDITRRFQASLSFVFPLTSQIEPIAKRNDLVSLYFEKKVKTGFTVFDDDITAILHTDNYEELYYLKRNCFMNGESVEVQYETFGYSSDAFVYYIIDGQQFTPQQYSYPLEEVNDYSIVLKSERSDYSFLRALQEVGNLFIYYLNADLCKSPNDLKYVWGVVQEILQQQSSEEALYCKAYNVDNEKFEELKSAMGSCELQEFDYNRVRACLIKELFCEFNEVDYGNSISTVVRNAENDGVEAYKLVILYSSLVKTNTLILKAKNFTYYLNNDATEKKEEYLAFYEIPVINNLELCNLLISFIDCDENYSKIDDNEYLLIQQENQTILCYESGIGIGKMLANFKAYYATIKMLPYLGQSLLCLLPEKDYGEDVLLEVQSIGEEKYDHKSYLVEQVQLETASLLEKDPDYKDFECPIFYNCNFKLFEHIFSLSNVFCDDQTKYRFAFTYDNEYAQKHVLYSDEQGLLTKNGNASYGKLVLIANKQLNSVFNELLITEFTAEIEQAELPYVETISFEQFDEEIFTVPGVSTLALQENIQMCRKTILDSLQSKAERPNLNFLEEKQNYQYNNKTYKLPFIPLGQVAYGLSVASTKYFMQQVTNYELRISRTTPFCPVHLKCACDLGYEEPGRGSYEKCPVSSCKLLFCFECKEWHEYVNPLERKCNNAAFQCPICHIKGQVDEQACNIVECVCGAFVCKITRCGRAFKTYFECEEHVLSHNYGLGIVEKGNADDLRLNPKHIHVW